jgi:phenylalanyl-tRNA synthetase beta chain
MKFSTQWLHEWVSPDLTVNQIAECFTMAGLELESLMPVAKEFTHVVVGEIVACEQHPNADRLRVCQVDVGQSQPLSIVCGGANARAGIKVCVAMIGAELPGDFKIKPAKLRGVDSAGMLCSEVELGLAETSEGIMELPEDAPIGISVREYLQLDDYMMELSLTANRGDCLSIKGLARELSALTGAQLHIPQFAKAKVQSDDKIKVEIKEPSACPRYAARVIKNIDPQAKTPLWMVERLKRSGIRANSLVVDVTNYVLLALGQPMHAFDLDKLQGGLHIRNAKEGENLTLLNGTDVKLKASTLIIADDNGPAAIAGVMGGLSTSVTETTRNVVLESAFFAPQKLAGTARSYGLHTDGGHRFERGVDPYINHEALEYASELIERIAGGQAGPIIEAINEHELPKPTLITVHEDKIEKILGEKIAINEVKPIMQRLGFDIESQTQNAITVKAPSHRFDIAIEVDLIEEIARIKGYASFPAETPCMVIKADKKPEYHLSPKIFKSVLTDRGYNEAITYSFIDPKLHALFFKEEAYPLQNPISSDLSVMRTSAIPGLVQALAYNVARQQSYIRFFEFGKSFKLNQGQVKEEVKLSGLAYGKLLSEHWDNKEKADFFDVKSDLEALLTLTGKTYEFLPATGSIYLHPGKSALIKLNGAPIGFIGVLHPSLAKHFDLSFEAIVFELDYEALMDKKVIAYEPISKFPSIKRDIAVEVSENTMAQSLCNTIKEVAGAWLKEVNVFDVYQGDKIAKGKKSMALGVILQKDDSTLTDEEVNSIMTKIIDSLQLVYEAQLRG